MHTVYQTCIQLIKHAYGLLNMHTIYQSCMHTVYQICMRTAYHGICPAARCMGCSDDWDWGCANQAFQQALLTG